MQNGFVKLYRKMLDNPVVCKDCDYFAVWCYLLLNATHKEINVDNCGETKTLQAGQFITGCQAISKKLNVSESKVKRILERFKIERMIEQITYPRKGRIITILNWSEYQDNDRINERLVDECWTNSERLVDGNKNVKNDKNVKNIKENIKRKVGSYEDLIYGYTDNADLINAIYGFIEMRNTIKKPLTDNALKLIFDKLNKLADNDEAKTEILNQSIMNSWQGVFELKNNTGGKENGIDKKYTEDDYADIGWG